MNKASTRKNGGIIMIIQMIGNNKNVQIVKGSHMVPRSMLNWYTPLIAIYATNPAATDANATDDTIANDHCIWLYISCAYTDETINYDETHRTDHEQQRCYE